MKHTNYGIQGEYTGPTAEELDRRWSWILARGLALAILAVLAVLVVLALMGWGLYDAVAGEAVCENVTCSVALKR